MPESNLLSQSQFYNPVFDAAIFDGPFRIYFSQNQESAALRLYFRLQNSMKEKYQEFKQNYKPEGKNIFIMMYPDAESFEKSFGLPKTSLKGPYTIEARVGGDPLLGVYGSLDEEGGEVVYKKIENMMGSESI